MAQNGANGKRSRNRPGAAVQQQRDEEEASLVSFINSLNDQGVAGKNLVEHLHAMDHLLNEPNEYNPTLEVLNMVRMVMIAVNLDPAKVGLPDRLPNVLACVNLSGKRMVMLTDNWCLASALTLVPHPSEARCKRGLGEVIAQMKQEGGSLFVALSLPYQAGIGAMRWELRSLRRQETPNVVFGRMYLDGGLVMSNLDVVPRSANPSQTPSAVQAEVRNALLRTFRAGFPVINLESGGGVDDVEVEYDEDSATVKLLPVLRKVSSDRKALLQELASVKEARDKNVALMREVHVADCERHTKERQESEAALRESLEVKRKRIEELTRERDEWRARGAAAELEMEDVKRQLAAALANKRGDAQRTARAEAALEIANSKAELERKRLEGRLAAETERANRADAARRSQGGREMKRVMEATSRSDELEVMVETLRVDVATARAKVRAVLHRLSREMAARHRRKRVARAARALRAATKAPPPAAPSPGAPARVAMATACVSTPAEWVVLSDRHADAVAYSKRLEAELRAAKAKLEAALSAGAAMPTSLAPAHASAPSPTPSSPGEQGGGGGNHEHVGGHAPHPLGAYQTLGAQGPVFDYSLENDVEVAHAALGRLAERARAGVVAQANLDRFARAAPAPLRAPSLGTWR